MSKQLDGAPERQRMRGEPAETYEERFPRYAHNAGVTAGFSGDYAARQRAAATMHRGAAASAARHGDTAAADLYDEMAKAALDAADALDDIATLARQVERHYESKTAAANGQERQS
jgi:hypothetical protein